MINSSDLAKTTGAVRSSAKIEGHVQNCSDLSLGREPDHIIDKPEQIYAKSKPETATENIMSVGCRLRSVIKNLIKWFYSGERKKKKESLLNLFAYNSSSCTRNEARETC